MKYSFGSIVRILRASTKVTRKSSVPTALRGTRRGGPHWVGNIRPRFVPPTNSGPGERRAA